MNKLQLFLKKTKVKAIKNAPVIALWVGAGSMLAAEGFIIKGTLDLVEPLENLHDDVTNIKLHKEDQIKEIKENGKVKEPDWNPKKDAVKAYGKFIGSAAKSYLPAMCLTGASLYAFVSARNIEHRRYIAAVTAYNALKVAFDKYRERVREEYGEEADDKIIQEMAEDPDLKYIYDGAPLAVWFDEASENWQKDPEQNRFFLEQQIISLNNQLAQEGFVFLDDVYKRLGVWYVLPPKIRQQAHQLGWLNQDMYPDEEIASGVIDFKILEDIPVDDDDIYRVKEYDRNFLIQFNCDGFIADKI